MKKTLIIVGIILVLLMIGLWVYLFMFGVPKSTTDVFSNFGFSSQEGAGTPSPSVVDTAPVTDEGKPQALRQLTTRPVAGAIFVPGGVRYVERGTGYVFEISFATGNETQLTVTTIPQTVEAIFSSSGNGVAITSEEGETRKTIVGSIVKNDKGEGNIAGKTLPGGAREVTFATTSDSLYYLLPSDTGSKGYVYDLSKDASRELFSIPLSDVEVLWGNPLYVYTTPSLQARGYIYRVKNNELLYTAKDGYGLMGISYDGGVVVSRLVNSVVTSESQDGETIYPMPFAVLPDKCTKNPAYVRVLYCAIPLTKLSGSLPDAWYKGLVSFSDTLWQIDIVRGEGMLMSNFLTESGRDIDVSKIGTNDDGTYIYFINKNDDTLWMFDTTIKK